MSPFWSNLVSNLTPYIPGEQPEDQNLIKLNTNENPYPPSSKVFDAIRCAMDEGLRLYPDSESVELKSALASYHHVKANQIFVGNGSDEVLAHVFQALLKHDKPLLFPDISYSFYPVYCGLYNIKFERISLNDKFEIDFADYRRSNGGIIFPNPNAPTGILSSFDEIESLLKANRHSVVVIDEAYIDFGGRSVISLIDRFENLMVVRTFSKSRSLAGLRVGYAVAHPVLIEGLQRVKNSFNSYPLDCLAQAGAVASLEDIDYFRQTCEQIIKNRAHLVTGLKRLGFEVLPSMANFVFASHPQKSAKELAERLREKNIIVRHFAQSRIENYLRISVGSQEECHTFLTALCE